MYPKRRLRLRHIALYFFKLGVTGFGGAATLADRMYKDLVEVKKILTHKEFITGLTLSGITPGPLSAQMAIYTGYIFSGIRGATVAAISFIFPSFLIVLALSFYYFSFGANLEIQKLLTWVGAAVVGILISSSVHLVKVTVKPKILSWICVGLVFLYTVLSQKPNIFLIIFCGLITLYWYSPNLLFKKHFVIAPVWQLFSLFFKAGAFSYGGGMAMIPFLHSETVNQFKWLTNTEFLNGVAISMMTPGPVAISSTFIGYAVSGVYGASLATIAIFLPVYLLILLLTPFVVKNSQNINLGHFIEGVTSASMGTIAASVVLLGHQTLASPISFSIAGVSLLLSGVIGVQPILIILATMTAGVIF